MAQATGQTEVAEASGGAGVFFHVEGQRPASRKRADPACGHGKARPVSLHAFQIAQWAGMAGGVSWGAASVPKPASEGGNEATV